MLREHVRSRASREGLQGDVDGEVESHAPTGGRTRVNLSTGENSHLKEQGAFASESEGQLPRCYERGLTESELGCRRLQLLQRVGRSERMDPQAVTNDDFGVSNLGKQGYK